MRAQEQSKSRKRLSISLHNLIISMSTTLPCLTIATVLELAFKTTAPRKNIANEEYLTWPDDNEGPSWVTMAQWPISVFQNETQLPITSAAVALVHAVIFAIILLYVMQKGPVKVRIISSLDLVTKGVGLI
jgi:hypothetical protein